MRKVVSAGGFLVLVLCGCTHAVLGSTTSSEETRQRDDVWIESDRVFMKAEPVNVTVTCRSHAPVRHCQFSAFPRDGVAPAGPLVSLGDHAPADTNATCWASDVPGLVHASSRLVHGGCELVLVYDGFEDTVVGCRVGERWGEWKYATVELNANERSLLPVDVNARELTVLPGHEATLSCNTSVVMLENCRVATPTTGDEWLDLDRGAWSRDSRGRHRYHGAGIDRGECGLTVSNVTDADAGVYRCLLTTDEARAQRTLRVVVAAPPLNPPVIRLDYTPAASPGAPPTVTATCTHDGGVPAPTVSWTLDNVIVTRRMMPAPPTDDDVALSGRGGMWAWPWTDTHTRATVGVSPDQHEGRSLRCYLTHVGLEQALESPEVEITHDYPPFDADFRIHYEKGITLKASCKTDASRPVANITWLIGDRVVRRDDVNDDDDVEDGAISQTLHVKLKPQDDARMFRCVVTHPALARPIEKAERVWYKPFDPLAIGMRDEVVVLPGHEANISCVSLALYQKYLPKIETCSFKLFGRQTTAYFHAADVATPAAGAGYRFHGGPVEYGGCGLTLERVTEEDNGRILCRIESDGAILFRRYITVVVAHPPTAPVLRVRYDGAVLKASCTVASSRPMATVAWMLNEDTIRQESGDDAPIHPDDADDALDADMVDGSYSHTHKSCRSALIKSPITQTVMWRLEPEDNGKRLRCVMTHPILDEPLEDAHEIVF